MYKVILVDDEPVTFKSIRSIMEKQPTEFEIVELCSNGRDVQEGLYLYPEEILTRPFRFRVEEIAEKYRDGISYITVVASEKSYSIEHVAGVIPLFYRTIAERTVVGKSQILFLENLQEKHVTTEKEQDYLTEILRFLRTNKYEYIPGCVKSILQEWARQEKPQLWFEGKVRQLLYVLIAEGYLQTSIEETEFILEEAFMNATSMAELEENILSVIYKNRKETEDSEQPKLDSPEYFQKIREYIWKNMAEPMTLQQVCREFGISQPYLSRFFKKYEGQSFSNYLAEIRIQRAKELLKANQDLLIKDIAYMVGYTDQFYFSRVFHSVAGLTPTEYVLNQ